MNARFGTDFQDGGKIIRACADKIMEDDDFVAKARGNSMADLRVVFGDVMIKALMAITAESQDMAEAFVKNEKGYTEFLNDNLLPYVYRRCTMGVDDE